MARSTYVYVVQNEHDAVIAVFTVKRQLEHWLSNPAGPQGMVLVTRHRDASPGTRPVILNPRTLEPAV